MEFFLFYTVKQSFSYTQDRLYWLRAGKYLEKLLETAKSGIRVVPQSVAAPGAGVI